MPRAPEVELQEILDADSVISGHFNAVYQYVPQRTARPPFMVVSLVSDNNERMYLSYWGGSATVQLDIYTKGASGHELRAIVKDAVRKIRGVQRSDLRITSVTVINEQTFGLEDTGLYRSVIDVRINYTEEK